MAKVKTSKKKETPKKEFELGGEYLFPFFDEVEERFVPRKGNLTQFAPIQNLNGPDSVSYTFNDKFVVSHAFHTEAEFNKVYKKR